jgi:RND family efflux transporter MFP subunit
MANPEGQMKRYGSLRHHILSLLVIACVSCLGLGCSRAVKPAEEKAPPAPVKWEGPRQVFLEEWTELVGTTVPLPDHAARVTSPVGGYVLAVLPARSAVVGFATIAGGLGGGALATLPNPVGVPIVEGQLLEKGDILAQLDATDILANLAKSQAAKKVLQAEREVAVFAVKQADLELKRLKELAKQQDAKGPDPVRLVSPVMLEKAALALESAQASLRADDRKLEAADKDEAALELQVRLYTLAAPRAGRLGRLQVVVGQTLPVGAAVAEILDIDSEIDVLCFVAPSIARKLELGQPAHVGSVDGTAGGPTTADPEGKVVFIADQAEAETGLFAVKVRFPNGDLKLRSSSVARVRILTKPGKACWAIPESALLEDQDPPSIVVVEDVEVKKNAEGKDEQIGKARRLQAKIGMRDRVLRQVEILSVWDPEKKWRGSLEEALIVVEKGQSLQTGDVVKLEEEEEEEPPKP